MAAKFELDLTDALRQLAEFNLRSSNLGTHLDGLQSDFKKTGSVAADLANVTKKAFSDLNAALLATGVAAQKDKEAINSALISVEKTAIQSYSKIAEAQVKSTIAAAAYRGELESTRKSMVETANNNAYVKSMERIETLTTSLVGSNKLLQAQINALATSEGSLNAILKERLASATKLETAETRQISQNQQLIRQLELQSSELGAANAQIQARIRALATQQAEETKLASKLAEQRRAYDSLGDGIQRDIAVQKTMNDGQAQAATFTERLNNQLAEQIRKYDSLNGGTAEQVARMRVVNKAREDDVTLLQRESVALEQARQKTASLNGGMAEELVRINERNKARTDQIKNEERYVASLGQLSTAEARAQAQDMARLRTMEAKNNATRAAVAAETALTEADARHIALAEKLTADLTARNTKTLEAARAAYGLSAAQKELNAAEQQQQAQLAKLVAQRDLLSSAYGKNMAQVKAQITQQEQLNRITAMSTKELLGLTNAQKQHNSVINVGSQSAASLRAALSGLQANIGMYTSGTIVAASSTYALFSALRSTVAVGAEFTASMAKANAVMNSNNGSWVPEGLGAAETQVRALGQTTIFTASEVAEGLIDLGQAGLSTGEAILALKPTLDLAQIGSVGMAQAADMATNVMMTFGKTAGDLTNIVDVMATAAVDSNTNVTELANALTYAGPAAHAAGISFEETTAAIETLSNSGIKSSRAGTALRKLFTSLLNPTKKGAEVLDQYNISTQNADGSTRNLVDIVNQLNKALNATGVSEAQRLSAIQNLVGLYATSPTAALIANAKTLETALNTLENNVTGAAERMRKKMSDTLQVDWKNTLSAYEELQLQVYEKFEAKLRLTSAQITKSLLELTTPVKVLLNTDGSQQSIQSLVDKANANKPGAYSVGSSGQAVDNVTGQTASVKELVQAMDQVNQSSLTVVSQLDIIIQKFQEWGTTAVEVIGALVVGKAFGALRSGFTNLSTDMGKVTPRLTELANRSNMAAKAMGATAIITSQTNIAMSAAAGAGAAGARGLGLMAAGATFAARAINGLAVAGAFLSAAAGWIGVIAGIGYAIYSLWDKDTNKGIVDQAQGVADLKKRYEELQVTLDSFGLAKEKQAIVEQIKAEKELAAAQQLRINQAKEAIATYKAAGIDAPKLELEVSINEDALAKTQTRIKDFEARVQSIGQTAQETKSANDGAIATATELAAKTAYVEKLRKDADSDFSDAHDAKQALYIEEKASLEALTNEINRQQMALQNSQSVALSVAETYRGLRAAAQSAFEDTFDKKGSAALQYKNALDAVTAAQKEVDDAERNNAGADVAARAGKKLATAMAEYGKAQQEYGKVRKNLEEANEDLAVAGKPAQDNIATYTTRVNDLTGQLNRLNEARKKADAGDAAAIDEQALEVTKKLTEAKKGQFAAQNKIDAAAKAAERAAGRKSPEEKMSDALDEYVGKAKNAEDASRASAAAYAAGSDAVAQYAIQQQVSNELLKFTSKGLEEETGARERLTKAITSQTEAKQIEDVQKSLLDVRKDTTDIQAQTVAVYAGEEALRKYNVQKQVEQILAGKMQSVRDAEIKQIQEQVEAQSLANKALESANRGIELRDQYAPAAKYARDYAQAVKDVNAAYAAGALTQEEYNKTLKGVSDAYNDNLASLTVWGKLTQDALNRVDEAFVDMWKNIGHGFDSFSQSLLDSFKQLLAELAHEAITKPIMISFTNSILGTNKSGGIGDALGGIFGDSSGGGGNSIASMISTVRNTVSIAGSSFGKSIMAGWNSGEGITGGLQNAFTSGADYVKTAISSAFTTGSAAAASTFTSETATAALAQSYANYGAQFGTGVATSGAFDGALSSAVTSQSAASSLSALSTTLSYIGSVYSVIQSYQAYGAKGAATTAGFAAAGAAIGSVVPVIGTAIGTAIGAVVGSFASSKLFGSGEKYADLSTSSSGNYINGQYVSNGPVQGWQTKAPKFGSAMDAQVDGIVAKFTSTLGMLYDVLGNGADVYAYDLMQVRKTSGKYSTTFGATLDDGTGVGLDIHQQFNAADAAAALQHNYDDVMGTFLAKAIVSSKSLPEYFKAQFTEFAGSWDTTADEVIKAIEDVFLRFNSVNDALTRLNVNSLKMNEVGLIASDNILNIVASMSKLDTTTATAQEKVDALNTVVNDYYSAFFSQAEQMQDLKDSLTGAFASFGLNLPDSKAAYRSLVESIDVSTAAGQAMFATFVGLSKSAASYYDNLEQNAQAAQQAALEAQQAALDAYKTYYQGFFSADEQLADLKNNMTAILASWGQALPATREGYRALVNSIDMTSDAGKWLYTNLMNLAGDAADYYDKAEDAANSAADALKKLNDEMYNTARSGADKAFSALQRAVDAQKQALETAYNAQKEAITEQMDAINTSISAMADAAGSLDSALKSLRGSSEEVTKVLYTQATGTLDAALSQVQSGKTLEGFKGLDDALEALTNNSKDTYKTLQDYLFDQGVNAGKVDQLEQLNGKQKTDAEKTLENLQTQLDTAEKAYNLQVEALDQITQHAQDQLNALDGIDTSVGGVAAAVAAMNKAVVDAILASTDDSAMNNGSAAMNEQLIKTMYQSILGRDPDAAGLKFWSDALGSGTANAASIAKQLQNSPEGVKKTVTDIYQSALGRAPDAEGLKFWSNALTSGTLTATQLAAQISNSAEGTKKTVTDIYQAVLGRAPDAAGLKFWSDALRSGTLTASQLAAEISEGVKTKNWHAKGASFTNGVVSRPTMFDASLMGEAGPEAILPLTNVGGSLGVSAKISGGSNTELVREIRELGRRLDMIQAETQATALSNNKIVKMFDRVTDGGNAMITKDLV